MSGVASQNTTGVDAADEEGEGLTASWLDIIALASFFVTFNIHVRWVSTRTDFPQWFQICIGLIRHFPMLLEPVY